MTELERLMQEQTNMITYQRNTIKDQKNMIICQKNMIGKLSEDRYVDSDCETYTTYSDTDDAHSPTRRYHHSRPNMKHMERTISCSTLSNYHFADTIQQLEEGEDEV